MHANLYCSELLLLQVLTTKQWAIIIVHAYPYLPTVEDSLAAFAEKVKGPSKQAIIKAAETEDMEAEWQALQEFIEMIGGAESTHAYLPLSTCDAFIRKLQPALWSHAPMPFGAEAAINMHYRL